MSVIPLDYPGAKILHHIENQVEQALRQHEKEPWTVAFVESVPKGPPPGVLWDIGACTGRYTLIAAAREVGVVAVEPSAPNYARLIQNLMVNNWSDRALVLPAAVGNAVGTQWLDYSNVLPGAANHTVGSPSPRRLAMHRVAVLTFTVDVLVEQMGFPAPTHMKIDTDGSEPLVLLGAEQTLKRETTQALMVEMPLDTEAETTAWLAERGFRLAERFDERGGHKIGNICYGRFERA